MKTLIFQGYGDDTFACRGPGIYVDRDNCASGAPIYMRVWSGKDAMIVAGQYAAGPAAGWHVAVAPADADDDERSIPEWPIAITPSARPYSPALVVTAPDDVSVELVDFKGRREPATPVERDALVAGLRQENEDLEEALRRLREQIEIISNTTKRLAAA